MSETTRNKFCRLLNAAIEDEAKAHNSDYPELATALFQADYVDSKEVERDWNSITNGIRAQEGIHHKVLVDMKERRCP